MIIKLYPENNALPIGPAVNRVGSALPLRIVGVPSGATGVAVSVFNADGAACNMAATRRGGEWVATVPASHFASWGKIARGLQVAVSYKDETDTTQTVVFVGDVRIEKTAAGDPEGTGKRSVPVTEVDEVADGSSMKDIRDKVNELARIVSGTATALVLMALPLSAATPLEDIPGTNEVYTAAETDAAIIRLAPAPGNYNAVSSAAMSAVQPASLLAACTASSNYTDQAIAAIPKPVYGRSWNRPGEWSMAYVPTLETESADLSEISTNEAYMVFSNYTARTVRGLSANVFPERVDPLSIDAPLPVVLSVPDGGTASGGVVSVPSNGLYRVRGVNSLGEAREILVPFASGRIDERTVSVYVADKDGTARKLANDHAASVLAAMTDADEATYIGETNTFRVWRTLSPTFAWPGVGNTTPFALSPHVMVTAAHYPTWNIDRWTSNTLTNWVSGGTFSVRRGPSVHLADWAATNGFTAAEIALAGDLTDVAMIPLVEGEIPTECCPWLASVDWLSENYVNLEGICAWAITQGNAYWSPPANRNALLWAIPVILRGGSLTAANTWMAAGGIRPGMVARQDVADAIGQYNDRSWYEIRGGDSGKPVWICDFTSGARRDILISHFHTVGSGPNYAAALPILRAYCAAHGDTIKEIGND